MKSPASSRLHPNCALMYSALVFGLFFVIFPLRMLFAQELHTVCGLAIPLDDREELPSGDIRIQQGEQEALVPPEAAESAVFDMFLASPNSSKPLFSGQELEQFMFCALERGEMRWFEWSLQARLQASDKDSLDVMKLAERVAQARGSTSFTAYSMRNLEFTRSLPLPFLLGFGKTHGSWAQVVFGPGNHRGRAEALSQLDEQMLEYWSSKDVSGVRKTLETLTAIFGTDGEEVHERRLWASAWEKYALAQAALRAQGMQTLLQAILSSDAPPPYINYLNGELKQLVLESKGQHIQGVLMSLSAIPLAHWNSSLDELVMHVLAQAGNWKHLRGSQLGLLLKARMEENESLRSFVLASAGPAFHRMIQEGSLEESIAIFDYLSAAAALPATELRNMQFTLGYEATRAGRDFLARRYLGSFLQPPLRLREKLRLAQIGYYRELPWLVLLALLLAALLGVRLFFSKSQQVSSQKAGKASENSKPARGARALDAPHDETKNRETKANVEDRGQQFHSLRTGGKGDVEYASLLKDYFDMEGVVSLQEIKTRYRKLAKELHPDLGDGNKDPKAVEHFHKLNTAYERLLVLRKTLEMDV